MCLDGAVITNINKQAGAELCQAQVKLGLAMLDLLGTKMRSSSLC